MIDARKLDRVLVLERLTRTPDAYGEEAETWAALATLRAQRVESTTAELLRAYGEAAEGTIVFRTRFLDGLTTSDRIVFEGDVLELVGIVELGRREGLELRTRTQTNTQTNVAGS